MVRFNRDEPEMGANQALRSLSGCDFAMSNQGSFDHETCRNYAYGFGYRLAQPTGLKGAKLMVEKRMGSLPVTRASKLAGIVANTDFLKVLVNGSNC
ncbi:MAG: hypothetical protein O7A08_10400 [SAR324 cluster bacterium]|nr:hypothetical protein [SAR324 cluster bacterium]